MRISELYQKFLEEEDHETGLTSREPFVSLNRCKIDKKYHLDFYMISEVDEKVYGLLSESCRENKCRIKKLHERDHPYDKFEIYRKRIFHRKKTVALIDYFPSLDFKVAEEDADFFFAEGGLADGIGERLKDVMLFEHSQF